MSDAATSDWSESVFFRQKTRRCDHQFCHSWSDYQLRSISFCCASPMCLGKHHPNRYESRDFWTSIMTSSSSSSSSSSSYFFSVGDIRKKKGSWFVLVGPFSQWNIPIFYKTYIFKGSILHCYVRLPECIFFNKLGVAIINSTCQNLHQPLTVPIRLVFFFWGSHWGPS